MSLGPGYEMLYKAFRVAEQNDTEAIKRVYAAAFKLYKDDYKYLTDLVMILNHRLWDTYKENVEIALLYERLWRATDAYACKHLKGEELKYFYQTTD